MKKSLFIIAMALGVSSTSVNATELKTTTSNLELTVVNGKVNPFCTSVVKGDLETVKKLIELGADVNESSNGMTPAMYAAKYNRCDILKLLVNHGANLKAKSRKGFTAKYYAKQTNAVQAIEVINQLSSKKKRKV